MRRYLPKTKIMILAVSLSLWSFSGHSARHIPLPSHNNFQKCLDIFPNRIVPTSISKTIIDMCKFASHKAIFAVRFDTTRKTPNWAVHKLIAQDIQNFAKRKRPRFFQDKSLEAKHQALDASYTHSGFSRGHIVPAYDMSWNRDAYKATFNLTNVVPQKQAFNAGPWLGMENAFRDLVRRKNTTIWDISGVYGEIKDKPVIGASPHAPTAPKCFYKIFIAKERGVPRFKVLAALFTWNDFGKRKTWHNSLTTLDQIQNRTGINFLQNIPVENSFDAQYWGVSAPQKPADCRSGML